VLILLHVSPNSQLHTGFYPKFLFQMFVLPALYATTWVAQAGARLVGPRLCRKRAAVFTAESIRTRFYEGLFLVTYTLYTSVSTTIFRIFKCQEVQGRYFLTADFSVECFVGGWHAYAVLAVGGILVYTIGIPLLLFALLRRNRRWLYQEDCPPREMHQHALVKRKLGAVYEAYRPHAYYFDLIDMLRRLLLTGGLILLGDNSNAQIFLGGLVCTCWLCAILACRPYQAFWDNVMSVSLSFQLLLIVLSGMALEIYRLTPSYAQDPYQRHAFSVFMVVASVGVIVSGVCVLVISVPCARNRLAARCMRGEAAAPPKEEQVGETTVVGPKWTKN
jgi:hypothetical protein